MIRQALGWCGALGNPQEGRDIAISQKIGMLAANVGREAIGPAIKELIEGRVIVCVREPLLSGPRGERAGLYALRWDTRPMSNPEGAYVSTLDEFDGFYDDGNSGCMTRVPDVYLDYTVLQEPLSVSKVIGCILRNTIGYQTGRGIRRIHVQYSQREIMERMQINSNEVISESIRSAVDEGHLVEIPGYFDPAGGTESRAAVYAIRWEDGWGGSLSLKEDSISLKEESLLEADPANLSEKRCGNNYQTYRKNGAATRLKNGAVNLSEKRCDINKEENNKEITLKKQQQSSPTPNLYSNTEPDVDLSIVAALIAFGFDKTVADSIVVAYPDDVIQAQLEYFPFRTKADNPQGMLLRAIQGNWAAPATYLNADEEKKRQNIHKDIQRREQHIKNNMARYQEYVMQKLLDIKVNDPEAWYLFEESESKLIDNLQHENPLYRAHPELLTAFLEHHNDESAIHDRAAEFFKNRLSSFEELHPLPGRF
ncbi:MAG: hypothetical protein ACYC0V_00150 [Armatimonadota bacterium]